MTEGYKKMKASLTAEDSSGDHDDGYGPETAYLAIAKYCDNFLRMKDDGINTAMLHYGSPNITNNQNSSFYLEYSISGKRLCIL